MIFNKILLFFAIFLYLTVIPGFCQGNKEKKAPVEQTSVFPEPAATVVGNPVHRAEQLMKAFAAAYPHAISRVEFRNNDWAVLLRDKWFYHAGARLLPEEEREKAESWAPQSFYSYFEELPPWKEPEGERAERLKNALANRRANPPKRHPGFYDTLWQCSTRSESSANQVQITFLGKKFLVHKELEGRLKKIEALIREAAKTNPDIQPFLDEIGSIGAWNWREVAATASRSYHSYGVAVDILPKKLNGRASYWQWNADETTTEWYKIPYSKRYHPPPAVVKAFERYGFCWGGKWPLFDTMHFEYRPEIMLLYGMRVEE